MRNDYWTDDELATIARSNPDGPDASEESRKTWYDRVQNATSEDETLTETIRRLGGEVAA